MLLDLTSFLLHWFCTRTSALYSIRNSQSYKLIIGVFKFRENDFCTIHLHNSRHIGGIHMHESHQCVLSCIKVVQETHPWPSVSLGLCRSCVNGLCKNHFPFNKGFLH